MTLDTTRIYGTQLSSGDPTRVIPVQVANPMPVQLTRVVGFKPTGVTVTNNSTAGRTWVAKHIAPGAFDAVRLVIYHGSTSSTTVYQAIVAATETAAQDTDVNRWRPVVGGTEYSTLDASEQYGWKSVTWGGASTRTSAAGTATAPVINVSDWIPLSSVPRSDGGTFPLLLWRVSVTGGTSSFTASPVSMNTTTSENRGFIIQGGWDSDALGSYVTAPNANNPVGALNQNLACVGVQFRMRRPGINLLCVGDSLTQCAAVVADNYSSWGYRAAADISALGIPCGFWNNGVAGQEMDVITTAGTNAISNLGAHVLVAQGFSPNGPGTFGTDAGTRFGLQQQRAHVQTLIEAARAVGAATVINSPLPSQVTTNASQAALLKSYADETNQYAPGRYTVDWWSEFTDDAAATRIKSTYLYTTDGLGVHVNEAGVERKAQLFRRVVRSMFGV